jgi:hypothetical protein
MAGTYGVDIHAFHLTYLFPHVFRRYGPAPGPAMLVAINAVNKEPFPVEINHAIANLYLFEPDTGTLDIKRFPFLIKESYDGCI